MALARMLVIVSFIFIITSSPIVALSITQSIVDEFFVNRRYTNIFFLTHLTYLGLGMFNCSAVNFFVYVLRSSRFRQELATFRCFGFLKDRKVGLRKEGVSVMNTVTTETSALSSQITLQKNLASAEGDM